MQITATAEWRTIPATPTTPARDFLIIAGYSAEITRIAGAPNLRRWTVRAHGGVVASDTAPKERAHQRAEAAILAAVR